MSDEPWPVLHVKSGPGGTLVSGASGSVRLPSDLTSPTEGWSPLPRVGPAGRDGQAAALDHLSPYRDFREMRGPTALAPAAVSRWHSLLTEAYELLRESDPAAHRMVSGTVRSVVPVEGAGPLRVVSASVPDAFGALTMSLPEDAQSLAATLVHESQHQLLTALDHLVPLLKPTEQATGPRYFAPWRADARPLRGLLFGAHAFAAVAAFWRGRRNVDGERADFEFAVHKWQVRSALAALRSAEGLTYAGNVVVQAMAELVGDWSQESVNKPAGDLAELCCRDQWASWRAAHLAVDAADADELARRWHTGRTAPRHLPPSRMVRSATAPQAGARTWLARLWVTRPDAFKHVWAAAETSGADILGITGASPADVALITGDTEGALAGYRAATPTPATCIGLGLTSPRVALLAERPELVLAVHAAMDRLDGRSPGPERLAVWLGTGLAGAARPSDTQ
ncbi:aKG-HExxH-type peptide beta-hydroxylase [Actinacidiphila glaucinigra]|uniref:aKG-HExxH-type peptide beta-hydroxylase n=1 Tax=Actinacidiphila glaucinigra TaxID=235986 RepID=UPI0036E66FDC